MIKLSSPGVTDQDAASSNELDYKRNDHEKDVIYRSRLVQPLMLV